MSYFASLVVLTGLLSVSAGTQLLINTRIIGGEDVAPGEIPYQVSVRHKGGHICGAALISVGAKQVIITAAHCVDSGMNLTAVAGNVNRLVKNEKEQDRSISEVIIHERFNGWSFENDIALLIPERPFEETEFVKPVGLPEKKQETFGTVIISGWGSDTVGAVSGSLQTILKKIEVDVIPREECQVAYTEHAAVSVSMICAGLGHRDTCLGDAGGPVVTKANASYLAGIISWGYACADPTHPSVNTQVSYFIDWIQEEVNKANTL